MSYTDTLEAAMTEYKKTYGTVSSTGVAALFSRAFFKGYCYRLAQEAEQDKALAQMQEAEYWAEYAAQLEMDNLTEKYL